MAYKQPKGCKYLKFTSSPQKGSRLQQWEGSCVSADAVKNLSPAPAVFQLVAAAPFLPGPGCLQFPGLPGWVDAPQGMDAAQPLPVDAAQLLPRAGRGCWACPGCHKVIPRYTTQCLQESWHLLIISAGKQSTHVAFLQHLIRQG